MLVLLIIFFIVLVGFKYVLYRKLQDIDGLGAMTSGMSESDEVVSVFEGDLKGKKKYFVCLCWTIRRDRH